MTQWRMGLLPGTGRALRFGDLVGFSSEPLAGLATAMAAGGDGAFKRLAALVVSHNFSLPPFLVVDLAAQTVFVCGDIHLDTPEGSVSGVNAATWREATLHDLSFLACHPPGPASSAVDLSDDSNDLVAGSVPAGGFILSGPGTSVSAPATRLEAADGAVHPTAADRATSSPGILDQQPNDRAVSSPAPLAQPPAEQEPLDWDPFDRPVGIDLAQLGRPTAPAVDSTASTTVMITGIGAPVIPPPSAVSDIDHPEETIPAGPASAGTAETEQGSDVVITCDDGQRVAVASGAQIGRNPVRDGLPPGHVPLTVRSEHVSRRHWELLITGEAITIRDLHSTAGTRIQGPDRGEETALEPGEWTSVVSGTIVHFADRWAMVEQNRRG